MDIRELPVDELVLDQNLNLRDRLNDETVERYVEAWERMPPITVFEVDGRWLVADGFHRHAAAVTQNRRTIRAEIRTGTFSDALDFVAGANLFHGLPLTRAERRRALEIKLRLHHEKSDRQLAAELGVSRELVAKTRRQLAESGQIPTGGTRLGADGKVYPAALARDPNENRPRGKAGQEDPRDQGGRESDVPPWDDTLDPMPPIRQDRAPTRASLEGADAKTIALSPPIAPAAPTIEEMLGLMTRQVMEVIGWTQADGFNDAYRAAGANARGVFQSSVIKLAARADQLRKAV